MIRVIPVVEGVPFPIEPALQPAVRAAGRRLALQLRPRYGRLVEDGGRFTVSGIIGTVALRSNVVLEVRPKVETGPEWIRAVLDLLVGRERIDASGERLAGLSAYRHDLLEAIAAIFAVRLTNAIRRDGPILMIERTSGLLPRLKGKLGATAWVRHAAWQPHKFPVSYTQLTAENDFSRALVWAASSLAGASRSAHTRATLKAAARALRPGLPLDVAAPAGAAVRQLPSQWSAYAPAWAIASALLAQRSLLGAAGRRLGPSVAIEAWPLLEELLQRTLTAAARISAAAGRVLKVAPKVGIPLLGDPTGSTSSSHSVEPDGRLIEGQRTIATFEAKYSRREMGTRWPKEAHIYQSLAAAAACESPLAILIYPDEIPPAAWAVQGFGGYPARLAAVGLGLFGYRAGVGDEERGRQILDQIHAAEARQAAAGALPIV